MNLSHLRDKLNKLFFLNNLIIASGSESLNALFALEDEIKELERIYNEVSEQLEECISYPTVYTYLTKITPFVQITEGVILFLTDNQLSH